MGINPFSVERLLLEDTEQKMHIHRNPIPYCVPCGHGHCHAMSLTASGSSIINDGSVVPFKEVDLEAGDALLWNSTENELLFTRFGIFFADWSLSLHTDGFTPIIISLEDSSGRIFGQSIGVGGFLAGSCLIRGGADIAVRLVNRSGKAVSLQNPFNYKESYGGRLNVFKVM